MASGDLGDLGTSEVSPVFVNIPPWAGSAGLLIWLILAGTLFTKQNRSIQARSILLHVIGVLAIWSMFKRLIGPLPPSAVPFDPLVAGLAIGPALVFLAGIWLARYRWYLRILLAGLIMWLAAIIATVGDQEWREVILAITYMVPIGIILFAAIAMYIGTRQVFTKARAVISVVLGVLVGSAAAIGLLLIPVIINGGLPPVIQVMPMILLLAIMVFLLVLPLLLLVMISPYWNKRLKLLLGLEHSGLIQDPFCADPDSSQATR